MLKEIFKKKKKSVSIVSPSGVYHNLSGHNFEYLGPYRMPEDEAKAIYPLFKKYRKTILKDFFEYDFKKYGSYSMSELEAKFLLPKLESYRNNKLDRMKDSHRI